MNSECYRLLLSCSNICRRTVPSDPEEECPYDVMVGTQEDEPIYQDEEPIYDSPKAKTGEEKTTEEPVYEYQDEGEGEDPIYDAIPVRPPPGRKISTEADGFFSPIRTRTHAYSMVRPKPAEKPSSIRQRKESFELVDIKQATLSTDPNKSPGKTPKYTQVVHREAALEEEDDETYNVPSMVKPTDDDEEIYYAPSLQNREPAKPPRRPVPQLPGSPSLPPPTRPPPSLPSPPLPPRSDLVEDPESQYVVQDPHENLVFNGE